MTAFVGGCHSFKRHRTISLSRESATLDLYGCSHSVNIFGDNVKFFGASEGVVTHVIPPGAIFTPCANVASCMQVIARTFRPCCYKRSTYKQLFNCGAFAMQLINISKFGRVKRDHDTPGP